MNMPWIEKYRPNNLDELVGQDDIIETLNKFNKNKNDDKKFNMPHLLFYGPPGTGKTSTILACIKMYYNNSLNVLELNASDQRGIKTVRTQIKGFAESAMIMEIGPKIIILDEADNMTRDAQFALRRVMEKYSSNVRFCLICNYASKLIPAIQSRCMRFRFSPLKKDLIRKRLRYIIEQEHIDVDENALDTVIKLGSGDMRKILNLLQSASSAFKGIVTSQNAYLCAGKPSIEEINTIYDYLISSPKKNKESLNNSTEFIKNLVKEKGFSLEDIITELSKLISDNKSEINIDKKIFILKELAEVEHRIATDSSEELQLYGFISIFYIIPNIHN